MSAPAGWPRFRMRWNTSRRKVRGCRGQLKTVPQIIMNRRDGRLQVGMNEGSSVQPLKIFMNYRHEDTPFAAWTLYRELKGEFGKDNIFFDQGSLVSGMQFLGEIKSHLASAQGAFIAVIGTRWITTMLSRRQRGDEDYVVKEIDLALRNKWTFIPLLVDDAGLPDPGILPQAIRELGSYQVA